MKINSISPNFGTKIQITSRSNVINHINSKFPREISKKFCVPMCDFWTIIDEKTSRVGRKPKKIKLKDKKEYSHKKYKAKKTILASTSGIDICTGGIVIGNNGRVGMFHFAPTLENFDLLIAKRGSKNDILGKSLDEFIKNSNGIKKAIIVGGKNTKEPRGEMSIEINKLIRNRFKERNAPTTVLTDYKGYLCDLFYHSHDDTLEVGIDDFKKNDGLQKAFGEVILNPDDTIELI